MKKVFCLCAFVFLASCGAMGIGSNHKTLVYNNSSDTITVSATSGLYNIKPEESLDIYSTEEIYIQSKNSECQKPKIPNKPNIAAMFLDVFPGFVFGIVPIFVDAVTNNLYKMPTMYSYSCE